MRRKLTGHLLLQILVSLLLFGCEVYDPKLGTFNTAIINTTVIDGTSNNNAIQHGVDILISNGRIQAIGKNLSLPTHTKTIDGTGKTAIPGLWDMHGHLYARGANGTQSQLDAYPSLYLAGGVTTVFSPGSQDYDKDVQFREKVRAGKAIGPNILLAAYVDQAPSEVSWMQGVENAEAARELILNNKDTLDAVKIYSSAGFDIAKTVVDTANSLGIPVTGHLGAITATQAATLGISGLEHGLMTMEELHPNEGLQMSNCAIANRDLHDDEMTELLTLLKQKNVYISPTIGIMAAMAPHFQPIPENWEDYLSLPSKEAWQKHSKILAGISEGYEECFANTVKKQIELIGIAHKMGIRIFPGTDPVYPGLLPGYGIHRELIYFEEAGISLEKIIHLASLSPSQIFGLDKETGSIEIGKKADLVIIDGDLTVNFAENINKTLHVFKDGTLYNPASLRASALATIQ